MSIKATPLSWPEGWPRSRFSEPARFNKRGNTGYGSKPLSVNDGLCSVREELDRMGVDDDDVVISTNLALRLDGFPRSNQCEPGDSGVAVYWLANSGKAEAMKVIAGDRYDRVADNLRAVAKTLEALRGIERWGGGQILERAFSGFTALPHIDGWRDVLGVSDDCDLAEAKQAYRRKAQAAHPDRAGGDAAAFADVQGAWDQALEELG